MDFHRKCSRSSLLPCSGRFLTSSSQHCREFSGRIFSRERSQFCINFYYNILCHISISIMSEISKENKPNARLKKDILHRIAKVQQNRMLRARENNPGDFEMENQKPSKPNLLIDFEEEAEEAEDDDCFYIAKDQQVGGCQFVENEKKTQELGVFCFSDNDDDEEDDQGRHQREKAEEEKIEEANNRQQKNIHEPSQHKNESQAPNYKAPINNLTVNRNRNKQNKEGRKTIEFQECSESHSSEDLSSSQSQEEPLKGVTITSNPLEGNVTINIVNKMQLLESPLPPGIVLKCIIRRSPNFINPQFDLYLHNGLKHLLSAKKYSLAKNDVFKLYSELGKYEEHCQIGAVVANVVHSIYWITKKTQEIDECEIKGLVCYDKMVKAIQRKMKVFLTHKQKIFGDQKRLSYEGAGYLKSHDPVILESACLGLKQNSIKNFTLVDEDDKDYEYLKLVKSSENMFELLIQHPLSPIQACAIALTRFDAQLK